MLSLTSSHVLCLFWINTNLKIYLFILLVVVFKFHQNASNSLLIHSNDLNLLDILGENCMYICVMNKHTHIYTQTHIYIYTHINSYAINLHIMILGISTYYCTVSGYKEPLLILQ